MTTDAQFQAQDDFRSLTNAVEVQSDPARLRRAKAAGKKIVVQDQKALAIKKKVATKKR